MPHPPYLTNGDITSMPQTGCDSARKGLHHFSFDASFPLRTSDTTTAGGDVLQGQDISPRPALERTSGLAGELCGKETSPMASYQELFEYRRGRKPRADQSRRFIRAHPQRPLPPSSSSSRQEGHKRGLNADFATPNETRVSRYRLRHG